jgi:hypothetical protein
VDRLAFVDEEFGAFAPVQYRQLALNGVALAVLLDADTSAPLTLASPREHQLAYLAALLDGTTRDGLREGRIAVSYCRGCLDASCGELVAASVTYSPSTVTWTEIGFETENVGTLVPRFGGWLGNIGAREVAPPEWWTPNPVAGLRFEFSRDAYVAAIEEEIARVGS